MEKEFIRLTISLEREQLKKIPEVDFSSIPTCEYVLYYFTSLSLELLSQNALVSFKCIKQNAKYYLFLFSCYYCYLKCSKLR